MIELIQITDIDTLMRWRAEVIENVFGETPSSSLLAMNRDYYLRHIPDGSHKAYIAKINDEQAGSGSICLTDELPSPDNPTGRCAYLMNIYVRENYREHGVGHAIVRKLVEEAKALNCGKIYLETTSEGRTLYESMGFKDLPDMMKLNNN